MGKFTFTSCVQWLMLCLLSVGSAWSQESFEVSVNRNPVRVGEQVQLTFTRRAKPHGQLQRMLQELHPRK